MSALILYSSVGLRTTGLTTVDHEESANFSGICPCFSRMATYGSIAGEGTVDGTGTAITGAWKSADIMERAYRNGSVSKMNGKWASLLLRGQNCTWKQSQLYGGSVSETNLT